MKTRNKTLKNTALLAALTILALALSLVEQMLPLSLVIPVPGIRLGLSNLVILFVLCYAGLRNGLLVTLCKCLLLVLLSGNLTSCALSLAGGLLAVCAMWIVKQGYPKHFSLYGVSISGAFAHNLGQLSAAAVLLRTGGIFYYFPFLILTAIATGLLTGFLSSWLFPRLLPQAERLRDA